MDPESPFQPKNRNLFTLFLYAIALSNAFYKITHVKSEETFWGTILLLLIVLEDFYYYFTRIEPSDPQGEHYNFWTLVLEFAMLFTWYLSLVSLYDNDMYFFVLFIAAMFLLRVIGSVWFYVSVGKFPFKEIASYNSVSFVIIVPTIFILLTFDCFAFNTYMIYTIVVISWLMYFGLRYPKIR